MSDLGKAAAALKKHLKPFLELAEAAETIQEAKSVLSGLESNKAQLDRLKGEVAAEADMLNSTQVKLTDALQAVDEGDFAGAKDASTALEAVKQEIDLDFLRGDPSNPVLDGTATLCSGWRMSRPWSFKICTLPTMGCGSQRRVGCMPGRPERPATP